MRQLGSTNSTHHNRTHLFIVVWSTSNPLHSLSLPLDYLPFTVGEPAAVKSCMLRTFRYGVALMFWETAPKLLGSTLCISRYQVQCLGIEGQHFYVPSILIQNFCPQKRLIFPLDWPRTLGDHHLSYCLHLLTSFTLDNIHCVALKSCKVSIQSIEKWWV